ncbi:MAG: hypothetical protein DNFNHJIP_00329 [Candidatus Argoarchaeum ethanivorans]|uniref:Aerotolerance regulator N-terminal domain-containing protein n=1 Tax=Candidatus Argoarchaeum ethanivorans TaxID=2608793 RepID=A0A812A077_9EURY|nr:MAG: hypothetical protein DNFNHJIP_00329 [Candidatus Argoarchaeum ethanivorans]
MIFGLPLNFANMAGLFALLSIIPLIILYLLRPKPQVIKTPSVMFLFSAEKEKKRFSTIRRFIKDPLFLIQLLVLILLAIAVAEPFVLAADDVGGGHTVIVLDASASMQADGRFDKAITEAGKFLSKKNTVILAENIPVVILRESPRQTASEALSQLTKRSGEADLSSAILLATKYLGEAGRIVVISDFSYFTGDNPEVVAGIARGSGIDVQLVPVSGGRENAGIVDGWFDGTDYNTMIHNYNEQDKVITLTVTTNNKEVLTKTRTISPQSSEPFIIQHLPEGKTTITLAPGDDFLVDNMAHIIIPSTLKKKVLHVSDGESPSLVALLLFEPAVKTDQASPDLLDACEFSDYGIVILTKSSPVDGLTNYVKSGGVLVVLASDNPKNSDLLPVTLGSTLNRTTLNILSENPLTENLDSNTEITHHLAASARQGAIVLVEAGDESPIVAYWNIGRGRVIYLGFAEPGESLYDPLDPEVWNSFHATPTYPLFWQNLIEWSTGSIDINEFNLRAGTVKQYPTPVTIKTPTSNITTETVLFDEVGFYTMPQGEVAVNLYSKDESDITETMNLTITETSIRYASSITETAKELDKYLIAAGILFILLELYYLRWRGEL